MKMKIGIGLIAVVLAAAVPAWRSVSADEAAPIMATQSEQVDAQMAVKGKALYARHCSHCHGFNMVNPGTVTYDLRQFPHEEKARFVHSVTHGKNGMPPLGDLLSMGDIDDLWAYLKTGGKQ